MVDKPLRCLEGIAFQAPVYASGLPPPPPAGPTAAPSSGTGVKRLVKMLSETFRDALCERDAEIVDSIRQHLLAPILRQVYRDIFPYACVAAAVALSLVALLIAMLFLQLLMFYKAPAGGS